MNKSLLCGIGLMVFCGLIVVVAKTPLPANMTPTEQTLLKQAPNLRSQVLHLAMQAYEHAREQHLDSKHILTIIDYSKPSDQRRFWVIDLNTNRVLFNTWVTHGKGSGDLFATHFSDQPESKTSSLGVFLTEHAYQGKYGYSLHLRGLEPGVNGHAYRRAIVIHAAEYASGRFAKAYGRLGRSWGCPALADDIARPVIQNIKEGTLIFAYYPDAHWLSHSAYLQEKQINKYTLAAKSNTISLLKAIGIEGQYGYKINSQTHKDESASPTQSRDQRESAISHSFKTLHLFLCSCFSWV